MTLSFEKQALLILAHGSSQTPCAVNSTRALAELIAGRNLFASVHCAFWKEPPGYGDVWNEIKEEEVFMVPHFISEGYFTREVIPREMELVGATTQRNGHLIHYCQPVGLHPGMTDLIIARANAARISPPNETSLLLIGHGTSRNSTSANAIEDQVRKIRNADAPFGEVVSAYLDESPNLSDWRSITSKPNVIAVPFLIAEGIHTQEDIPRILGQSENGEPTIRQTPPIGIDPAVAEMIIDQAIRFDQSTSTT